MAEYQKPRIKLGELITFIDDKEDIKIIAGNGIPLWKGSLTELRYRNDQKMESMLEEIVDKITEDCFHRKVITLEKRKAASTLTISDFPKRDIYITDLLHLLDNKQVVLIMDCNGEDLWIGRVEELVYTKDGILHELATTRINWFEATTDARLDIYLEEGEVDSLP